ncbi:hypothetical protein [Rothia nasimurium]|uniref:hypothetical protein n=1 Tax=Rothia nasimurium TaxID=85336 RepID=UPI001F2CBCFD|nr:hypothetical protein [Rothia nasimurium]
MAVTAGTSAWGATVEIIDSAEPHRDSPSPWNGSYPRSGDRITIEIWVNKERVSSYNLLVDEVTYTLTGATLKLITDIDKFTQTKMRLPGLLKKMPRTTAEWASDNFSFRYPAPMTMWAVSEAFRAAGYHTTPPIHSSTVIDAPMQGAFWANEWRLMGDVVAVSAFDRSKPNSPTYGAGEGRLYFHDGYMLIGSQRPTTLTGNFRLSFIARKIWAGTALFKVISGFDGLSISLRIDASRNIVLADGGPALTIPARDWADGEIVSLVVYGDRFSLAAGSREIQGTLVWGNRVTGIEIQATAGAMIAGVQVDNTSSLEHRVVGFRPTADIHPGRWASSLEASPSIRDRTPKAVLDEIAEKTLSSWWIDGDNIAHFESAEYLLGKKPSHEVNALEHIADYVIEDSLLLKRAAVDIKYSKTAATYSHYHGVTVWAKGGTADAGSQNQEFVGPPDAEDWFDIDATFGRIADNPEGFNKRNSSWCGVSVAGATHQDTTRWTDGYKLLCEEIVPWRWLITETFEKDCTRTIAEDSRINRDQWGKDSVLMRARGKVERSDVHLTIDGGPPNAPGLDIDCTGYIDRDEVARSLAQWLFDQVKDPQPVLKTLTLRYDPRIVLGDAIRVFGVFRDGTSNLFGAILLCSVIAFEHNAETATSTVTVRVTANEYKLTTWDALEEKVRALGLDWNEYESKLRQQGISWDTFEKDPIAPLER